jgi:hypothetical protein
MGRAFKELGFKTVTGLGTGFEACCYYGGAGEILSDILFLSFKIKSKNWKTFCLKEFIYFDKT